MRFQHGWAVAIFLLGLGILLPVLEGGIARAADSAVILQYHRFGEDDLPTTSVTLAQFDAQLEALASGLYTVLPVEEIVQALKEHRPLPERTIGITIDDGGHSVFTEAWPRLKARGFPFTLFVATDDIDQHHIRIMSWDEVRTLAKAGVTIGHHSAAHAKMWLLTPDAQRADLARADARFLAELGEVPKLFAYPYGEFDGPLKALIAGRGFLAAFGQHSGVASLDVDLFALPRFALNEHYGEIGRFRTVIDSLPLAVDWISPADPVLQETEPDIRLQIGAAAGALAQLTCYASGQGRVELKAEGARTFRLRLAKPFVPGRNWINCTLPTIEGRNRWFGMQYILPGGRD
jgi:peptidoglycan/xylan/chitin deacetylase (PgdA/CDA1 family)